jgi:hypothetical protein
MEPPGSPGPPDEAHIALLQEMGFSEERCREALRLSSNQARAQSLAAAAADRPCGGFTCGVHIDDDMRVLCGCCCCCCV